MKFLAVLTAHLNLIPVVSAAAQEFLAIGHSKETALEKIVGAVETSALVGEQIPNGMVSAISGLVAVIVEGVFGDKTVAPAAAPAKAT